MQLHSEVSPGSCAVGPGVHAYSSTIARWKIMSCVITSVQQDRLEVLEWPRSQMVGILPFDLNHVGQC